MTNGEVAGITGDTVNFMDLAGKMVGSSGTASSGGARAFLGDTMSIDGLKGLMAAVSPPSAKKKRGEDEEEDKAESAAEEQNEDDKKEKVTWFDRDKAVSSAKRSAFTSTLELKQKLEKQVSDIRQAMAELDNPLYSGLYVNEKAVAKKGFDGLEAVLGADDKDLQSYIGSFDEEMGANGKKTIGKAPPCRNYADLVPISKIQGKIDGYDYCTDKKGVETLSKEISSLRKPIVSLLAAASSGLIELKKAVERDKKSKASSATRAGSCNPSPTKKPKVDERKADLFQVDEPKMAQVPRLATEEAWKNSKWDSLQTPLLVTSDCVKAMPAEAGLEQILSDSSQLVTALAETKTNFLANFERQKQPLRAMQAIENLEVEGMARKLLLTALPCPDAVDANKVAWESKAMGAYGNGTAGD